MKKALSVVVVAGVVLATAVLLRSPVSSERAIAATQATVAASSAVRADGHIKVTVTSNAKRVAVRFTKRSGSVRILRARLHSGRARVLLPRGAASIRVRALATRVLARSPWVKVVPRNPATPAPRTPQTPQAAPTPSGTLTAEDLVAAAGLRVYFGHQSVGGNIMGAVPGVFASLQVAAPPIVSAPTSGGGFLAHGSVGVNGDPSGKVADFDADMRNGLASTVDVALMKFCYVDVTAGTDVQRLFQKYRDTLNGLSADYPQVRFVAVTVPLTVDSPADNVTRTRLNAMIRQAYPGRLFDLAAVESTRPDGTRVTGSAQGQSYEALHPGYSSDGGHLNPDGARRAAAEMLRVIARAPHAGS